MNSIYHHTSHLGRCGIDLPISLTDAQKARNTAALAKAREQIQAWRDRQPSGLPMDKTLDALREVANMTAEEEARLNAVIEAEEAQA